MTHSTRTAGRRGRRPRGAAAFGSEARVVLLVACPAPGPGCCQEVALAD